MKIEIKFIIQMTLNIKIDICMNKGNNLLIVFKLIFAVRESPQIIAENDINIQRNAFHRIWN